MKRYIVRLSEEEREQLKSLVNKGKGSANKLMHARILLKVDIGEGGPGWRDIETSEALEVSVSTVEQVRERLVEEGLEGAMNRRKAVRYRPRKLGGEEEAQLVKLACSQAPDGRERWTLKLLGSGLVELGVVESISPETVRQTLKKTR